MMRNFNLLVLVLAEFAINVGRGALTLVLGAFLYKVTGGLWAFAAAFLSDFLIAIFIQGVAGTTVDRVGPSKVLNLALGCSTLIVLVSWICLISTDTGDAAVILMIGAVLLNVLRPFIRTAVFVLLPTIFQLERLEKANGLMSVALQTGQIVGMLVAGVSLEVGSASLSLFIIMMGFAVSTFAYFVIGQMTRARMHMDKPVVKQLRWPDYITLLGHWQLLQSYIIGAFDYVLIALFNLILAPVVTHNFNDMPRWLTILDGAFALGAIVAGVFIARKPKKIGVSYRYTFLSLFATGLLFLGFALEWHAAPLLILVSIFGASTTVSVVVWSTNLQSHAPEHYRGRVATIKYVINALIVAVAISTVSWANDYAFTYALITAGGIVAFFIVITALFALTHKGKLLTNSSLHTESASGAMR